MNCHQNVKLHYNFVYLYQIGILIHDTSLKIKLLILLFSCIFKLWQHFVNIDCFKLVLSGIPLTFMNILSILSANFESTVNDILGHVNFKEIKVC